jgi:hypothetical protein
MPQFKIKSKIEEFSAEIEIGDYAASIMAEGRFDDPTYCTFSLHYVGDREGRKDRSQDLYRLRHTVGIQVNEHLTMQSAVNAALAALKWVMQDDLTDLQNRAFDLERGMQAVPETFEAPDTPPVLETVAA